MASIPITKERILGQVEVERTLEESERGICMITVVPHADTAL